MREQTTHQDRHRLVLIGKPGIEKRPRAARRPDGAIPTSSAGARRSCSSVLASVRSDAVRCSRRPGTGLPGCGGADADAAWPGSVRVRCRGVGAV